MKKAIIAALSILILVQAYAFSQAEAQSSADIITYQFQPSHLPIKQATW